MKTNLPLIALIFLLLGCSSEKEELQGLWLLKHIVYLPGGEFEEIGSGRRSVISFDRGTYKWKNFVYESLENNKEIEDVSYVARDRRLFLSTNKGLDTVDYNIEVDTLTISGELKRQYNLVTERLVNYNLGGKESEFREFILSTSFMLNDSTRLEFRSDGKVITPEFDFYFGDKHLWKVEDFENELFLSSDGYRYGFLMHIEDFNAGGFKGTIYGEEKIELAFQALQHKVKFHIEDLIGEWTEYSKEDILQQPPPRMPPPIIDNGVDVLDWEELLVTDSIIIYKFYNRIDTIRWDVNREHDLLLLENKRLSKSQKKWKIIHLNKDQLWVERIPIPVFGKTKNDQLEIRKYVRKEK